MGRRAEITMRGDPEKLHLRRVGAGAGLLCLGLLCLGFLRAGGRILRERHAANCETETEGHNDELFHLWEILLLDRCDF